MKTLIFVVFSVLALAQVPLPSPQNNGGGGGGGGGNPAGSAVTDAQCWASASTFGVCANINLSGGVSTGVGGAVGGYSAFGQGTATTAPTSSVGFMAPTSVTTKFMMTLPAAPAAGFIFNTGTSDPSTLSFVPTVPVANGGTGITSFGTGVATALGTNVSGTGAICLASGSACAGGGATITPVYFPFGTQSGNATTQATGATKRQWYVAFTAHSAMTASAVNLFPGLTGYGVYGFADVNCTIVAQSAANNTAPANPIDIAMGTPGTIPAGTAYFVWAADTDTGMILYGGPSNSFSTYAMNGGATPLYFYNNISATGSGSSLQLASGAGNCGTRTAATPNYLVQVPTFGIK